MNKLSIGCLVIVLFASCRNASIENTKSVNTEADSLAQNVVDETLRSCKAYKQYAWGHDELMPLSKSFEDWYEEPLYISPIDAFSTLYLMGLKEEAKEIENYVVDSLDFNKDIDAKIFEVNIRILGGLLTMYEHTGNPKVLEKTKDFADRMLPAFNTKTGIPTYWVNLKSGVVRGDTVNVAEAATYTFEMGILSCYTKDPKYYQAGKRATLAIYERRSDIGLIGEVINVQTGEWISEVSHLGAGIDSYYEYLYKSYLLFGDEELGKIWKESIGNINKYLAENYDNKLWYGRADMRSGELVSAKITLYDAFFPAILALSRDLERAGKLQKTWEWLWDKYGLEPMEYDYKSEKATYPVYDLNPEIIESAYYLYHLTGDTTYFNMNKKFWSDIKKYCRTDVAFTSVENVETMEKKDYMPTFFFAETLKYFYLTFSHHQGNFNFNDYVFNTEAHPFRKSNFNKEEIRTSLGLK
ncbi:hypothetical protein MASR2M41_07270 [Flammeovirgaceae bacterium]